MDFYYSKSSSLNRTKRSSNDRLSRGHRSDIFPIGHQGPLITNVSGRRVFTYRGTQNKSQRREGIANSSRRLVLSNKKKLARSIPTEEESNSINEVTLLISPEFPSPHPSQSVIRKNSRLKGIQLRTSSVSSVSSHSASSASRKSSARKLSAGDTEANGSETGLDDLIIKDVSPEVDESVTRDLAGVNILEAVTGVRNSSVAVTSSVSSSPLIKSNDVKSGTESFTEEAEGNERTVSPPVKRKSPKVKIVLPDPITPVVIQYRKLIYDERNDKWIEHAKIIESERQYKERIRREHQSPKKPSLLVPHSVKGRKTARIRSMFPTALIRDHRRPHESTNIDLTDKLRLELHKRRVPVVPTYFQKHIVKFGPIVSVEAVEGKSVQLPCDVSSPDMADKVYMVLWFKADSGIPLYRLDVRGTSVEKAHHDSASEVFGTRAYFRTISEPAALVVEDIRRHDQGIYRCRVDFRNSATKSFRYNLTIIVPAEKPVILNWYGQPLNSTIGPLNEGDDVVLSCRVIGGSPEPKVRWLVNNVVVDDEYEVKAGDVIENKLTWPAVTRKDLNSIFTCRATNTKLTDPQENSVILDMRLRPVTIQLFSTDSPLIADKRYDVTCISSGSRPPAIITWYKNHKQLRKVKESIRENTTESELNFVPTTDDDGKTITCRAENPVVSGLYMEDHWKINIIYAPIVTLKLGNTLKADDIKEGADVYFECHVKANPPWKKLIWLHNGAVMNHNSTGRVIRSHYSLVLQKLTRHSAGRYACIATNPEGETQSNELTFRVKYAPTCRHDKTIVIGASRSENLKVICEVDADPPANAFRWKFNNSGETLDVGPERFESNGSVSILTYTPVADLDYGTLSCWAHNSIGMQVTPCVFQLVAAGKPQSVQNCTMSNQTNSSVEIKCYPGYDGGLPQVFTLEVYTHFSAAPVYNITQKEYPIFNLANLPTDVIFSIYVYAVNSKGRSPSVILEEFSFKDPEKRTADGLSIRNMAPVLGVAVGTIIGVILLIVLILLNIWRSRNLFSRRRVVDESPDRKHNQLAATPIANHCDDINPDLIPSKYEPSNSIKRRSHQLTLATENHIQSAQQQCSPVNRTWDIDKANQGSILDPKLTYGKVNNINYQDTSQFCRSTESISSTKAKNTLVMRKEDDLNCTVIKETLMTNRLPESCV